MFLVYKRKPASSGRHEEKKLTPNRKDPDRTVPLGDRTQNLLAVRRQYNTLNHGAALISVELHLVCKYASCVSVNHGAGCVSGFLITDVFTTPAGRSTVLAETRS